MRHCLACALITCILLPSWAPAQQDDLSSDQLRRMYDDLLTQLRAAQDRRNELARENERLRARIVEVQRDLEQTREQLSLISDTTLKIRSERAAWLEFLRTNPVIRSQWFSFLQQNRLPADPMRHLDPEWPLPRRE